MQIENLALQRRSSAESVPPRMGAALALAETLLKMDKAPAFGHDPIPLWPT
jgi:4'-phosphopantetheinyl transferase EntD